MPYKLHSQGCSCFYFFFSILLVLHTQDTFALVLNFEVGHFTRHFLLLSFFFLVLLWKEFNPHSFVATFHFSHLFSSPPVFIKLDSCERQLFCLRIQHATHCLFEQQTSVGSSEAAVCRFCLSISLHTHTHTHTYPVIWWSHRWQPGVGLLHLALLCGNDTSSSDSLSAEVSSIAYVLFTSRRSPHTLLMVIILALWVERSLSLPLSKVFKPMTGHPVNKDILWADCTCNTFTCIRGRTPSIWGLHPDTIAYVVSHLLLFGLIWRWSAHCTNRLFPLWGTVSLLRSVSRSDDIIPQWHYQNGHAHNRNAIRLPIHLESPWRLCCEMLCHCQQAFQLVPHARRTGFLSGW